jgi:hypothetical protein
VVALKQPVHDADDGLCASPSRCVRVRWRQQQQLQY